MIECKKKFNKKIKNIYDPVSTKHSENMFNSLVRKKLEKFITIEIKPSHTCNNYRITRYQNLPDTGP